MTSKFIYVEFDPRNGDALKVLSELSFSTAALKSVRFHLFYPRDTPDSALPPKAKDWIVRHPTSTQSPDATRVAMVSHVVSDRKLHNKNSDVVVLASKEEARLAELQAVIKPNSSASIVTVSTRGKAFLDCFEHICKECYIIFKDFFEKDQHERFTHSLLCDNTNCDRSKKDNGFDTKDKLIEHVAKQRKCELCASSGTVAKFCSVSKKDEHVRLVHSKSRASKMSRAIASPPPIDDSGNVIHFRYGQYPLQCSVQPSCLQRFSTTEDQVKHHVTCHDAEFPYVCVLCASEGCSRDVFFESKASLVEHGKTRGHKREELIFKWAVVCILWCKEKISHVTISFPLVNSAGTPTPY